MGDCGVNMVGSHSPLALWLRIRVTIFFVLISAGLSSCSSVTVIGKVEKPGKVRWFREMTVREAIVKAGGGTEFSKPLRVHVARGYVGVFSTIQGRNRLNPDDIVRVMIRRSGKITSWKAND